jgi:hypothetical protein
LSALSSELRLDDGDDGPALGTGQLRVVHDGGHEVAGDGGARGGLAVDDDPEYRLQLSQVTARVLLAGFPSLDAVDVYSYLLRQVALL